MQFINTTNNTKHNKIKIGEWCGGVTQSSNLLSEVTAMSVKVYSLPCFKLTSPSFMNSVSVFLLSCCTCGCCTFIDLYLIGQESMQFINTTNNTKHNKIKIGEWCGGVTAVKDKIYIGGSSKVLILNTDGSRVREITSDGFQL
jgi:hypothetical protein